ncbi:hypothetical protein NDU88_005271 [Pleurodeles waltl]|uniref:Uncharacterized protein n=1 Tax=Pleurodeles waltl TaxID=8319 RepID=A0AAV7MZN9_PLEWA|nr:hypothetical protein NDU88_005271 [Pleurodeles waltl]
MKSVGGGNLNTGLSSPTGAGSTSKVAEFIKKPAQAQVAQRAVVEAAEREAERHRFTHGKAIWKPLLDSPGRCELENASGKGPVVNTTIVSTIWGYEGTQPVGRELTRQLAELVEINGNNELGSPSRTGLGMASLPVSSSAVHPNTRGIREEVKNLMEEEEREVVRAGEIAESSLVILCLGQVATLIIQGHSHRTRPAALKPTGRLILRQGSIFSLRDHFEWSEGDLDDTGDLSSKISQGGISRDTRTVDGRGEIPSLEEVQSDPQLMVRKNKPQRKAKDTASSGHDLK